jgi:beta-lactamase class A
MRFPLTIVALALATPLVQVLGAAPAAAQQSGLTRLLEAELARFPSKSGIYVKHLATGEEATVDADGRYDSASTIKVAIMVLAYQLADQGKLDLDERYEIKASDFRGGSGIFRYHDVGLKATWRDIITQMIITSDNSATDIMIKRVGGVEVVNNFLRGSGYTALKLNKTTLDYFRGLMEVVNPKYRSLSPEDLFALQSNVPYFTEPRAALIKEFNEEAARRNQRELLKQRSPDQATWLGVVTPRETGRMMEGIEAETIASKSSCQEMKRILRAQQAGTRKIPHFLSVPVGHKTGETMGVTNDIGIIYAKSGPIIITSFNMQMAGLQADGDDRIGHVARIVAEYFDGAN